MIHLVSSVFAGSASKWIAATVNIVFALLTLWMVRKILYLFGCDDKEMDLISIFLILSPGIIQNLSFFRMYVMVMFMVALCTYWILKSFDTKRTVKFYAGISIIAIVGTLTHYYFLIYLFFISLFFGLYLLFNRKFVDAVKYILSMLVAGGGCYIIFPAMIKHIFDGYRGKQAFENINTDISVYWDRLKTVWSLVNKDLFGGCLMIVICICCFVYVAWGGKPKRDSQKLWMWGCMGGACIGYFMLVAKIAAYTVARYMYPIYAVALVFVLLALKRFLDLVIGGELRISIMLWAVVLGVMISGGYKDVYWEFLYLNSDALLETAASYREVDCLYAYKSGEQWKLQSNYMEVKNYRRAIFFENSVDQLAEMQDLCKESEFVLYIVDCDAEAVISQIMKLCPQINAYDKLGSYAYATSYHLYGKDIVSDKGYLKNYDQTLYLNCEEEKGNICVSEDETLVMTLKSMESDYYNLYLQNGVVDLEYGVLAEGQNIQKFWSNGTDAQKWNLAENADGTVTIYAYNSNYCLTYDDAGNIVIGSYNQDDARQKWWFQSE